MARRTSLPNLLAGIDEAVIRPALEKHQELLEEEARDIGNRHIKDYVRS